MSVRITPAAERGNYLAVGTPDAARSRWQGVLSQADRDWCRNNRMTLGWDPAQAGWIVADDDSFVDDLPEADAPLSHHAALTLRMWQADDLPAFHAALDDALLWQHMPDPYPAPLTRSMAADLIAVSRIEGHHAVRAVVLGTRPVGQVRLEFGRDGAEAELSYWLARAEWHRGTGRRMVARAVDWAFGTHPALERLTARVRPANQPSLRLLRRAGFAALPMQDGWEWFSLSRQPPR